MSAEMFVGRLLRRVGRVVRRAAPILRRIARAFKQD